MHRVKVVLHAADPLSAAGLAVYLESHREIEVLRGDRRGRADVVVVATGLFSADVAQVVRRHAASDRVPVVLVVSALDEWALAAAAGCGAVAVLPSDRLTGDRLVSCVVRAASSEPAEPLVRQCSAQSELTAERLKPREQQVLRLLADGFDTTETAERLGCSERTVKNVLYGVISRYHLSNRPHAIAYAMRRGLI